MKLRMYLRGLGLGLFVAAAVLSLNNNNKEAMTDSEIIAKAKQLGMEEKKTTLSEELKKAEGAEKADAEDVKAEESKTENPKLDGSKTEKLTEQVNSDDNKDEANKTENQGSIADVDKQIKENTEVKEEAKEEKAEEQKPEEIKEKPEEQKPEEKKEEPKPAEQKVENKPENKEEKTPVKKNSRTTITIVSGVSSETVAKLLEKGGVIDSASKFDKYLCDKDYDNKIATGTHEIPEGATYEEIARIITNR